MHKEFQSYILNEEGSRQVKQVAALFDDLLSALLIINPDASREMALVRTKLEEAAYFARKAMASQERFNA